MHKQFVDEMLETLVEAGAIAPEKQDLASQVLSDYWRDKVADVWKVSDVKALDPTLTDEQCRAVLDTALHSFDATVGINTTEIALLIKALPRD